MKVIKLLFRFLRFILNWECAVIKTSLAETVKSYFQSDCLKIFISLVQVQLRTEVLCAPSMTQPWFELMTSRSWQYTSCHWDTCFNHSAINDSHFTHNYHVNTYVWYLLVVGVYDVKNQYIRVSMQRAPVNPASLELGIIALEHSIMH